MLVINCITTFPYVKVWGCPDMRLPWNARRKTRRVWSPLARAVLRRRARWSVLAGLEGKEIQQVAGELAVSVPTVGKWRKRFALWGLRATGSAATRQAGHLRRRVSESRAGPAGTTTSAGNVALGWAGSSGGT